jgi:hypothetical protein
MVSNQKIKILGSALLSLMVFLGGCSLSGISGKTAAINKNGDGLALKGYDAVAYFTDNLPTEGKPDYTVEWNGAKWQFASATNRDAFQKDPAKYAPQYGGYCSWAVSHGYTADTDPQTGKVVGGKLYLNYNKDVAAKWSENIPKYVADADQNWKNLADKAEASRKDK